MAESTPEEIAEMRDKVAEYDRQQEEAKQAEREAELAERREELADAVAFVESDDFAHVQEKLVELQKTYSKDVICPVLRNSEFSLRNLKDSVLS